MAENNDAVNILSFFFLENHPTTGWQVGKMPRAEVFIWTSYFLYLVVGLRIAEFAKGFHRHSYLYTTNVYYTFKPKLLNYYDCLRSPFKRYLTI